MKIFFLIATIIFSTFISACNYDWFNYLEDDCDYPDYSDCNTTEPFNAVLKIKLTVDEKYPKNTLTLYDGYFEDRVKIDTFNVSSGYYEINVPLNRRYALAIQYISNNDTIIAVDGTKIEKTKVSYCDSACWTVTGENVDLRLRK